MADETIVLGRTSPIKSKIPTYSTPHKPKIFTHGTRTPRGLDLPKAPQLSYLSRMSPPRTPQYSTAKRRTPVRATPSLFISPSRGMEDLKDILPPFQSPWRSVVRSNAYNRSTPRKSVGLTPRKSIGQTSRGQRRISGHRPRLSKGLTGSSSFLRTPLKSGKRLSSIIPPVGYLSAVPTHATPRASLDEVYEEVRLLYSHSATNCCRLSMIWFTT